MRCRRRRVSSVSALMRTSSRRAVRERANWRASARSSSSSSPDWAVSPPSCRARARCSSSCSASFSMRVRAMERSMERRPRSMRLASSTSPSRSSRGTVPMARRYMRTGSPVESTLPSSLRWASRSSLRRAAVLVRYLSPDSTISIPWLPNRMKMSSSSSGDLMESGRTS